MIKVKPRAVVDDDFILLWRKLIEKKTQKEIRLLQATRYPAKERTQAVANNYAIVKGDKTAIDKLKTKLRSFPFTRFGVETVVGEPWLVGETREIVCEPTRYRKKNNTYQLGRYLIYIKTLDVAKSRAINIHFVPLEHPYEEDRHMHHYAEGVYPEHPTEMVPRTCWGGFGSVISADMDTLSVEMFRTLHLFLSSWTPNDTLRSPSRVMYAVEGEVVR
jgi:hypothetical protein